ncbi:MAG: flagellar protein FliS [Defluviitaleaceae bacterium]|nr:flagellar protein FliS [Defluviitaleaceae bacterium]
MADNLKDKAAQIEAANPVELLIINYELLIDNIDAAIRAKAKSGACDKSLAKARECIAVLYENLDLSIEIARDFASIYMFVNGVLIRAGFARSDEEKNSELSHARNIMAELMATWQELLENAVELLAAPEATSTQLYAGLTYGPGGELTEFEDFDPESGYKI